MSVEPRPGPDPERFFFRGLAPHLRLGTASDRYAGWLGQIYCPERFAARVSRRQKKLGKRTFTEEVLPVESVEEYFQHFDVLELDYTFYRPLLDAHGDPTPNYHALRTYRAHLGEGDRLLLKAPQAVTAQKLHRGGTFAPNPEYLDADLFRERFLQPAADLLGPHLGGVIFEQEYQRKSERVPVEDLAASWDRFFGALPRPVPYHLELRTEAYLQEPLFRMLESRGVGQVLSHWTWLPPLWKQFQLSGERFFCTEGEVVIRLMTPRNVRYEDAYAAAHPFDRLVEGMLDPLMVRDTVAVFHAAADRRLETNTIVNNRAGGNAPLIAREIARTLGR